MGRKVNNTMTDALMIVGGGIVGAGLALLLAPQSGRKTRNEIARFGKTIGRNGKKAVRDVADRMGDAAAGIMRSGKELTKEGKKGLLTAVEKGQEALESQKRKLARMVG